jgi:hypothetical protein
MRPVPLTAHLKFEVELPDNRAGSIKLSPRVADRYDNMIVVGLWDSFYAALDGLAEHWFVEHENRWSAFLTPRLADPSSLAERTTAALAVLDALNQAPVAGNEFALVDWAVAPLMGQIEARWTQAGRVIAGPGLNLAEIAADFSDLRAARAPLLARHLAGGLSLSDLGLFQAVHHDLDPLTAFLIAALAQPAAKWSLATLPVPLAPPLNGVVAELEQRRLARLSISRTYGNYLERTPRLARLLSADEALALPNHGRTR